MNYIKKGGFTLANDHEEGFFFWLIVIGRDGHLKCDYTKHFLSSLK